MIYQSPLSPFLLPHMSLCSHARSQERPLYKAFFTSGGMLAAGLEKGPNRQPMEVLRIQNCVTLEPMTSGHASLKQQLVYPCSHSISRVPGWEKNLLWNNWPLPGNSWELQCLSRPYMCWKLPPGLAFLSPSATHTAQRLYLVIQHKCKICMMTLESTGGIHLAKK